jgi:hypothetical protein
LLVLFLEARVLTQSFAVAKQVLVGGGFKAFEKWTQARHDAVTCFYL